MNYEKAKYGMNKELMETTIIKSQLKRWKDKGYSLDHILVRLWEIHFIKIKKETLINILKKYDLLE